MEFRPSSNRPAGIADYDGGSGLWPAGAGHGTLPLYRILRVKRPDSGRHHPCLGEKSAIGARSGVGAKLLQQHDVGSGVSITRRHSGLSPSPMHAKLGYPLWQRRSNYRQSSAFEPSTTSVSSSLQKMMNNTDNQYTSLELAFHSSYRNSASSVFPPGH